MVSKCRATERVRSTLKWLDSLEENSNVDPNDAERMADFLSSFYRETEQALGRFKAAKDLITTYINRC